MSEDYIIEKVEKGPEGETSEKVYYRSLRMGAGNIPLKTKIKIWALVIGGIALGVILFLFFITAFFYLFIPFAIILTLWNLFSRKH